MGFRTYPMTDSTRLTEKYKIENLLSGNRDRGADFLEQYGK